MAAIFVCFYHIFHILAILQRIISHTHYITNGYMLNMCLLTYSARLMGGFANFKLKTWRGKICIKTHTEQHTLRGQHTVDYHIIHVRVWYSNDCVTGH